MLNLSGAVLLLIVPSAAHPRGSFANGGPGPSLLGVLTPVGNWGYAILGIVSGSAGTLFGLLYLLSLELS